MERERPAPLRLESCSPCFRQRSSSESSGGVVHAQKNEPSQQSPHEISVAAHFAQTLSVESRLHLRRRARVSMPGKPVAPLSVELMRAHTGQSSATAEHSALGLGSAQLIPLRQACPLESRLFPCVGPCGLLPKNGPHSSIDRLNVKIFDARSYRCWIISYRSWGSYP